ncbi:hypothetical protein ACJVC5_04020 [Peredibacter sp. HCB2-198]|uniref:hypothetical protein n=1 Tax=Peredibacter sp. HCB2-198 TaxID=3383025 RepID=UPI0038B43760
MWIILGVLLSFSAFALEPFEKIKNVKILRVLPNNIVMLNRGLEDGILRNDHAKLSNDTEGYSSRAICIRAGTDVSYWRLYRIPNSEAFSLDYVYTISGMADREIPFPEATIRDHRAEIAELDQKPKQEAGPDPFTIKRDLPEKLTERDLIQATGPEKRKLFVEKALNQDQMKRDLEDYRISLYASPFTRQSINEGESLRYGFRGGNVASKYRLLTQFEQQQTKLKDPLTKESVSTRSTFGQAQFVIHRLTNSISSLSIVNYGSQRFSELATPKSHWQVGPIGFTWHMYESKTWEYLDLSYVPLYDIRNTEVMNADGSTSVTKKNGLRHGFRFALKTRINERVALENLLWVRPFQELDSWELKGDDLNMVNDLRLIFSLTDNFFFDYNFIYQKDKLWKTLSNLPETNTINSLNLRYDFDV